MKKLTIRNLYMVKDNGFLPVIEKLARKYKMPYIEVMDGKQWEGNDIQNPFVQGMLNIVWDKEYTQPIFIVSYWHRDEADWKENMSPNAGLFIFQNGIVKQCADHRLFGIFGRWSNDEHDYFAILEMLKLKG